MNVNAFIAAFVVSSSVLLALASTGAGASSLVTATQATTAPATAAPATIASGAAAGSAAATEWNFRVYLDDTPIGRHRFTLQRKGDEAELRSDARFEVKLLFITAYRYAHQADERWRGNCLTGLNASTDDDGRRSVVQAQPTDLPAPRLNVSGPKERLSLVGCVMSYAYWNPDILRQGRLLNAQTGEYEAVQVADLGEQTVTVRGVVVPARRYRIAGPKNPIDLWYSPAREWLALEAAVDGGRRLKYRIE